MCFLNNSPTVMTVCWIRYFLNMIRSRKMLITLFKPYNFASTSLILLVHFSVKTGYFWQVHLKIPFLQFSRNTNIDVPYLPVFADSYFYW